MKKMLALVAVSAFSFGCEREMFPPERPNGVPEAATWAGGVDGGNWFHCMEGKQLHSYTCSIYWDTDGALRARGTYVLRKVTWDRDQDKPIYSEVEEESELAFDFFDGIVIHLQGEFVLIPHGIIDFPFGDGHGKKQRYKLGSPQGPEEEY